MADPAATGSRHTQDERYPHHDGHPTSATAPRLKVAVWCGSMRMPELGMSGCPVFLANGHVAAILTTRDATPAD